MKNSLMLLGGAMLLTVSPVQAQVSVGIRVENNTPQVLRAGGSTSQTGWQYFQKEPAPRGEQLRFLTNAKFLRGSEGHVEIVTEAGQHIGTVRFNFPFVGDDLAVLEMGAGYYGYINHWDAGGTEHMLDVDVRQQLRPPVKIGIPRTGNGVVRGRISWDPARLQTASRGRPTRRGSGLTTVVRAGNTVADVVKSEFNPKVRAPSAFLELDPAEKRPHSFQGKLGLFGAYQAVGQVRWLASDESGISFEVYDLPTGVPLDIEVGPKNDPTKLFVPGPSEKAPPAASLVPPGSAAPVFSVRVEYASRFQGPLTEANPRYENFNLSLHPMWMSTASGDSAVSMDEVAARLRGATLTRINPNPVLTAPLLVDKALQQTILKTSPTGKLGAIKKRR